MSDHIYLQLTEKTPSSSSIFFFFFNNNTHKNDDYMFDDWSPKNIFVKYYQQGGLKGYLWDVTEQ